MSRYIEVSTGRKILAVCEWWTYDVWGNARDGYEVNDRYVQGEVEIPVVGVIMGVPTALPGEDSATVKLDSAFITYALDYRAIKAALGITGRCELDGNSGDDLNYEVVTVKHEKPVCGLRIVGWKEVEASTPSDASSHAS